MTVPSELEVTGRLQRALAAFQKTQGMLLTHLIQRVDVNGAS